MSIESVHCIFICTENDSLNQLQPRPQGLLLIQNGGSEKPLAKAAKWLQKFVRINFCHVNTIKCLRFV